MRRRGIRNNVGKREREFQKFHFIIIDPQTAIINGKVLAILITSFWCIFFIVVVHTTALLNSNESDACTKKVIKHEM
ncbi:hypothetical protein TNIN_288341 [Trichonephila inaurata madagascariensis]|uniref:Uncharacterized protein n=1 Tax=Trichonephila inaurata madagascariensis TaxID=2747483 RepID=A0A8X6Y0H0_9ARAC|nr:hypothetical protein TNIN_288341 [Trichonephila inaurata madagascariensis]